MLGDIQTIYRRYLDGEMGVSDAERLVRECAGSQGLEPCSLDVQPASAVERRRSEALLGALVNPTCRAYFTAEITAEDAARQLAPVLAAFGTFSLMFDG